MLAHHWTYLLLKYLRLDIDLSKMTSCEHIRHTLILLSHGGHRNVQSFWRLEKDVASLNTMNKLKFPHWANSALGPFSETEDWKFKVRLFHNNSLTRLYDDASWKHMLTRWHNWQGFVNHQAMGINRGYSCCFCSFGSGLNNHFTFSPNTVRQKCLQCSSFI